MRTKLILIVVGALAVYLVGNGRVPLWDRDEPRYAQTSRQMLESGDWIVPKLLDTPREKKPVFIYWCQAASMRLLDDNDFAARLPSAIGVVITLVLLAAGVGRVIGRRRGWWTVFVFATSGLTIAAAKMCITDGVLILFVTAAQVCLFWMITRGASWPAVVGCGLAAGFALLTKGPVVLGVLGTTWLAFQLLTRFSRAGFPSRPPRSPAPVRILKWAVAIVLAGVILLPWLIPIEQRLPGYTLRTIKAEVLDRAAKPQEGHKGPPGYYLLLIWVTYFPWSVLLPATLVQAWKRRHLPAIRFALAAVIGPWVLFELVATKLPHYVLPVFPMLAFLTADMVVRAGRNLHKELTHRFFRAAVGLWAVIVALVTSAPWLSMLVFRAELNRAAIAAMVGLTIFGSGYGVVVAGFFRRRGPIPAALCMGGGMWLMVVLMYGWYLPNAGFLRTSQRVADILHAHHARGAMMIDYKEDTLPWYEGGTIRAQRDDNYLINNPREDWPDHLVITKEVWDTVPADIQQEFDSLPGSPVRGWAYSDHGRIVEVIVLRKN